MATALVPYRWKTDDGMPHWALPDNVTSAIDLRPTAMHVHLTALGYAVAVVDGDLPEGAIELGTGNVTRDRDAWERALFFRPSGDTVDEMVWSHLTDGADDAGEAACRPLRCHKPDRLELHLGGRKERQTTATERLKQAVLIRADLARMVDDETIPRRMLGKFLQAEADRMGIDAVTLRGKAAKLRDIRPERPETTIADTFTSGTTVRLSDYPNWTVNGEQPLRFRVFSDGRLIFDGGALEYTAAFQSVYGWHSTSLSSSNNEASLAGVSTSNSTSVLSVTARGNGSTSGYMAASFNGFSYAWSVIANVATELAGVSANAGNRTMVVQAIGSTIKASDNTSAWQHTVTNTALTVGLRVGVHGYSAGSFREASGDFAARDFLTPTVSSISPSSGALAGGTAVTITGTGF